MTKLVILAQNTEQLRTTEWGRIYHARLQAQMVPRAFNVKNTIIPFNIEFETIYRRWKHSFPNHFFDRTFRRNKASSNYTLLQQQPSSKNLHWRKSRSYLPKRRFAFQPTWKFAFQPKIHCLCFRINVRPQGAQITANGIMNFHTYVYIGNEKPISHRTSNIIKFIMEILSYTCILLWKYKLIMK